MRNFISVLLLVLFTGCATYTAQVPVSNVIPPRMQQQINTAADNEISFHFSGHPEADSVIVQRGDLTNIYRINKPLKDLYQELVETKFQKVTSDSKNQINVEIKDFNTVSNKSLHTLNVTVAVQLQDGNRKDERILNYQTIVGYNFRIGSVIFLPNEPINQLLQKFVIASDKYIDTFYEIN